MTTYCRVKKVAFMLCLSERQVQRLAKSGILPKPVNGMYELYGCVHAYIKYLKDPNNKLRESVYIGFKNFIREMEQKRRKK